MTSTTASVGTMTATLTSPHTDPYLTVVVGDASFRLRVNLDRAVARSTGPLLLAVVREAVWLLRRHTGYAPDGRWARLNDAPGSFAVGIREIPGRCEACVHGCRCQAGGQGCAHLGCRGARSAALADSCPGAALLTVAPQRSR